MQTRLKRLLLRQLPDAYDRFSQKSVYEANTKHHFSQHFSISGHTTAPLFFDQLPWPGLRSFLTYPGLFIYVPFRDKKSQRTGSNAYQTQASTPQTLRFKQAADHQPFIQVPAKVQPECRSVLGAYMKKYLSPLAYSITKRWLLLFFVILNAEKDLFL